MDQALTQAPLLVGRQAALGQLYDELLGCAAQLERIAKHELEEEHHVRGELWRHAARQAYAAAGAVIVAIAAGHGGVAVTRTDANPPPDAAAGAVIVAIAAGHGGVAVTRTDANPPPESG